MSALPRGGPALILAAAVVGAWLIHGGLATAGHLGFDALPLYAAGAEGPIAAFTDELMGGRYPDGRFHRPVTSLLFWLDGALGGAAAPGRARLFDVLIVAVGAWLTGLVAARLAGTERRAAALTAAAVAALVVVLSPAQLDLAPFPARRAEGLCAIGLAWTLLAALARDGGPVRIGAAALFAIWSKETGVLALPLAAAGAACAAHGGHRLRAGARAGGAVLAAIAVAVTARLAVLGEIGGHADSGLAGLREAPEVARAALESLSGTIGAGALGALVLACGLSLAAAGRGRAAGIALGWLLSALLVASLGGRIHAWYAGGAIAPLAVLAGTGGAALLDGAARARLAGVLAWAIAAISAYGAHAPEARARLDAASAEAAAQVERFERAIDTKDRVVTFPGYVVAYLREGSEPLYLHAPYSLEAAAELHAPDRIVRVRAAGTALEDARDRAPADLVVELGPPGTAGGER